MHDRQIPIYRKVPGSINELMTIINIYVQQKTDNCKIRKLLIKFGFPDELMKEFN